MPRNIKISVRGDSEVSAVIADPMQVERAVMNLVVNARDAMPDGGELTLATRAEEVVMDDAKSYPEAWSGSHSVLEVRDTGSGMDADTARRVFEPFLTTKEGPGGTGLGLPVVYGIARQAGGHVRVRSVVGVGSTFSLYFPVPGSGDATVATQMGTAGWGGPRVLLVDDESGQLAVGRRLLQQLGCEVVGAPSGREAVKSYARDPTGFMCVVVDWTMPEGGGEVTFRELRRLDPAVRGRVR